MKKSLLFLLCVLLVIHYQLNAQNPGKHKGVFKEYKPGYYQNQILKGIEEFKEKDKEKEKMIHKTFKMDLSSVDVPASKKKFVSYWHNDPVSQGNTGTCWCYSCTSFFESEIYRIHGKKIKLSEMYTVYYEYVERAIAFVEKRGHSLFAQGSEANAVPKIWRKYGIVPLEAYSGLLPGQTFHSHKDMFAEMKSYLEYVKENNMWNVEQVVATIKNILNHYMGEPPTQVMLDGKKYSPQEYLSDVLQINLDDFVDVLSIKQQAYWEKAPYEVPDNWWFNEDYHNVPLDIFMLVIKESLKNGYTLCIGGDVSEAGFDARDYQAAVVPSFDIPSDYIDENARQFRFSNRTTTDDHGMQVVGWLEKEDGWWFLLKDSGAGSRTNGKKNKNFGYYFFHEDYIKLKMMDFMVHTDMLQDILKKF